MSATIKDEPEKFTFPALFKMACLAAMALGAVTFGLSWIGGVEVAMSGWTIAVWYAVGFPLFAMFFLIIQNLSSAGWHATMKRVPEAMLQYFPVAFVTFLLLILAAYGTDFYEWAHPEKHHGLHGELLQHKKPYLNPEMFAGRLVLFFVLWSVFGFLVRKLSTKQDETADLKITSKTKGLMAIYAPIFAFSVSFASFDYIMSIEATWFSTMFGVYQFAGIVESGFAMLILLLILLRKTGYLRGAVNENHFHNLGIYLFASATFWAYIWFCQFMLIWYSNIPEETQHFFGRWEGPWFWVSFVLNPLLNWVLIFFMLLPRPNKRNIKILGIAAILALVGRFVDLWQSVAPRVHLDPATHTPHATQGVWTVFVVGVVVGMIGLFVFVTLWALEKAPLLATKDPYFEESLHHHL